MNGFEILANTINVLVKLIPPKKPPKTDFSEMRQIYDDYHTKRIGMFDSLIGTPAVSIEPTQTGEPISEAPLALPSPEKGKSVATSCIACSRAHMTTIAGALDEGIRFAREGGIMHPEAVRRIEAAEKEAVMLERIDLSPEAIQNSPEKDQKLARQFLPKIRKLRQDIGQIATVDQMEQAAAEASVLSQEFRLRQMEAAGADLSPIMELARRVQAGELTIEQARVEARKYLPAEA